MTHRTPVVAETVLDFWLDPLAEHGLAAREQSKKWYTKNSAFDDEVRERFLETYEAIVAGEAEALRQTAYQLEETTP